jgi:hypothetical protein
MDVVVMLADIVDESLVLFLPRRLADLFDALVLEPGILQQIVAVRHIGLVVLVVMEFERLARHVRFERIIGIGQRRKF